MNYKSIIFDIDDNGNEENILFLKKPQPEIIHDDYVSNEGETRKSWRQLSKQETKMLKALISIQKIIVNNYENKIKTDPNKTFKILNNAIGMDTTQLTENRIHDFYTKAKNIILSKSKTCTKCNNISLPMLGSFNKYKCVKCKRIVNILSSEDHNIGTLLWHVKKSPMETEYNLIVEEITEQVEKENPST